MNYWLDPSEPNMPLNYFGNINAGKRSAFLVSLFKDFIDKDKSILEVGCNVGRNMAYLYNSGYKNITGIELFPKAARVAKVIFEDTDVKIHVGSVAEVPLPKFDVVFTMAVLEHIQDDSTIPKVSDLTREYLITIEDEVTKTARHFPRNYKHIFEGLSFNQIYRAVKIPGATEAFEARIFKR